MQILSFLVPHLSLPNTRVAFSFDGIGALALGALLRIIEAMARNTHQGLVAIANQNQGSSSNQNVQM